MIPEKLTLQGLYSYKEPQTIDFSSLTAAGLFGIFGAVGSGKSSLLEAILLALYGSTERLSDRGEKNSMVNLQSESLRISFEFRAGKNNQKRFLARYSVKRNPKNFDEIRTPEHHFYRNDQNEWIPIPEKAEAILGMKLDHFKQTVIIPQGKFREFIDLTPGPRASMMKELFGLERFDLSGKTGILFKKAKEEMIKLETRLEALEALSPEKLAEEQAEAEKIAHLVNEKEKAFEISSRSLQEMERFREKHQELIQSKKTWEVLQQQLPEIEKKKEELKKFLQANTYLRPVWEKITEEELALEEATVGTINCTRFKETYKTEIETLEKQEAELKRKVDQRPQREAKIRDLQKVLEIQGLNQQLRALQENLESLKPQLETAQQSLQSGEKDLEKQEQEAEYVETADGHLELAELQQEGREWRKLLTQKKSLQEQLERLQAEASAISSKIAQSQALRPAAYTDMDEWMDVQKEAIKALELKKDELIAKKALQSHAHALKEGEACPLCGSLEHPFPLAGNPAGKDALTTLQKSLQHSLEELEQTRVLTRDLLLLQTKQEHQAGLIRHAEQEREQVQLQLNQLLQILATKGIEGPEALDAKCEELEQRLRQQTARQKTIRELRKQLDQLRKKIQHDQNRYRAVEQQLLSLRSTAAAKEEEISDREFGQAYLNTTSGTIRETIAKVQQDIRETAHLLDGKQKVLKDTRDKAATNLANLQNFVQKKETCQQKLESLKAEYAKLVLEYGFSDDAELTALFTSKLNAEKTDRLIREYEQNCSVVNSRITELEKVKGVVDFRQQAYDALSVAHGEAKGELEDLKNQLTLLLRSLAEIREKLSLKSELSQAANKLQTRLSYLKELEQLFKGSGFVKYLSRIYLQELCNTANLRFSKLTKNSLSLEIDDANTFWVTDHLNGGKKRLLKTLSGGQTFQASLCLALALAEKIKSLNQADQSFFFLDEGFGALDRQSLRVVFETLKALRHENRIVGIISHVEELQQEIAVYATIELDPEKGSQVQYSFR
ncbi:exonuclease SbcC [Cyclobacterium xiamenense]|uniref:Exonuclease SbcC n=1 Tax=Cyclobacterium xiamenense TaxID=1297121 RepID=A0A1H6XYS2_9BACT|nr:SMC family ATPase [Cyclobacterium xiamenense]SEJ34203.1 exonuclease SbcC [Cyclobacterium xiamenense]